MKKLLFTLLALCLMGCEGDEGPMGPQGPPGEAIGPNWHIAEVEVLAGDWHLIGGDPGALKTEFYAEVTIPELTKEVFENGVIQGFISPEANVKSPMPYIIYQGEPISPTEESLWSQKYDYTFAPGKITLYVSYSNFETTIPPGDEFYTFVLNW